MSGIIGAIVQFKNPSTGVVVASAVTDINGAYSVNVPDGVYVMNVVYPTETGYMQVFDHTVISDPVAANNSTSTFPVPGVDVVAGEVTTVSVYSNRVASTGSAPITYASSITNDRTNDNAVVLTIPITTFSYMDPSGNIATHLKIVTLPASGVLKYNGSAVTQNQIIALSGGTLSYPITFESDQAIPGQHSVFISFAVKTDSSASYSNTSVLTVLNTAFNSVTLLPYTGHPTYQIKARSSCPDQAFITDTGTSVVCTSLLPSQVKTALGATCDATWAALFALPIGTGEDDKINHWSNFAPTEWYVSGGFLVSRKRSVYDFRSTFAGYHHDAIGPSLNDYSQTYIPSNGDTGVSCDLYLGEINWGAIPGIVKVGIRTYKDATLLGQVYVPLTQMVGEHLSIVNPLNLTYNGDVTLISELYFYDSSNLNPVVIPGISTFTTQYSAGDVTMYFVNTPPSYQAHKVISPLAEWSITSYPNWVTVSVYSGGVLVNAPYLSGYDIRVAASNNTGVARTGAVVLSDGMSIDVSQQGGNPILNFVPDNPITLLNETAEVIVAAQTVPFSFDIESGVGNSDVTMSVLLFRVIDMVEYQVGSTYTATVQDGVSVSGQIMGLTTGDIDYGFVFKLYIGIPQ